MAIEEKWWPWKPSLFTQYRIRITNELRLAQRHEHCKELRRQIDLVEQDIIEIFKQMTPINFTQIDQKLNSCIALCQTEQKHIFKEYYRIKKQLIHLTPKILIGNAYLHARSNELSIKTQLINNGKKRKRLKLTIEQQWRKGIGDAYRKLQIQRDKEDLFKHNQTVNISIPNEPLPIIHDEQPIIIDEIKEHEFIPPLPPTLIDEIIIPFQTPPPPPNSCRLTSSDPFQLAVDDTIVKPHRLINKTLGNMSHMSFHIDPDQCSSPKPEDKKKKTKLKKLILPTPLPPPPLFSSTAIFDTHAFFTQTTTKTKKQKKKIDIARQPIIMTINDTQKKKIRTKKSSPYDFQDDNTNISSRSKGAKLLTDDIITARFAKNSHYQSHQTSMASTKSSKSQHKSNEREHKQKKKKNILGIGTSSPSISSTNLTLSPGRLSTDDKDDDYEIKSSLSRRHNRTKPTNKSKRTRVK
ncbi:unnamed protein product [Rotaria sordida]|uniref:Uncharacterized protein n=1 Tax=Rotaria sordida TaxID=392033 RepID=A0A813YUT1_9BILA|nr:unnamed protein product [Rotaria sordida]